MDECELELGYCDYVRFRWVPEHKTFIVAIDNDVFKFIGKVNNDARNEVELELEPPLEEEAQPLPKKSKAASLFREINQECMPKRTSKKK
jgi:hypothetical protein